VKEFPFDTYDFFGYIASGLMVLIGLDVLFDISDVLSTDMETVQFLGIVLASYVVGQMLATPAKGLLEDLIVRFVLGRPSIRLMGKPTWKDLRRFLVPGYFEPLRPSVQDKVRARAKKEGLAKEGANGEDLFIHIRFHPEVRTDEILMARTDAFLNKYGFNRNVCFASLCLLIAVYLKYQEGGTDQAQYLQYAQLLCVSTVLLFYRYLKFLRLYSFELFSSYAAGSAPEQAEPAQGGKKPAHA
jgi:hypothetical protein